MSWSNNLSSVLIIIVAFVVLVGGAAGFTILVQFLRQGDWRLAEPSVMKRRWQMVRPLLLLGAVFGLILGIALVFLNRIGQSPPAATKEVIISPPIEIKSRPRESGQHTE